MDIEQIKEWIEWIEEHDFFRFVALAFVIWLWLTLGFAVLYFLWATWLVIPAAAFFVVMGIGIVAGYYDSYSNWD